MTGVSPALLRLPGGPGARTWWSRLCLLAAIVLALPLPCAAQTGGATAAPDPDKMLRVCQDPNNLPFSHHDGTGFENRIAALFAQQLGWQLETTWFPQRIGFIRNTLRARQADSQAFKCDLVTGVPTGFDMAATTHPYYRSSYAMVYVKGRGRGLDGVQNLEAVLALPPAQRSGLRFGVFTASPVTDWLMQNGLMDQVEWYQIQSGDAAQTPGETVERDLASGKIDLAFVWGPIAGYLARTARPAPIVAVTLTSHPGMKLDFAIAMAVRHGDTALQQRIDRLIATNQRQIDGILTQYGVPLLANQAQTQGQTKAPTQAPDQEQAHDQAQKQASHATRRPATP